MNHIKRILLVPALLLLFSCDPVWYDRYIIDNQTDRVINLYYQRYLMPDMLIEIDPQTSMIFLEGGGDVGYAKDYGVQFLTLYFDSIHIDTKDSTEISKDFLIRDNWEFTIVDSNNETAIYEFILTDQDLK